MVAIIKEPVAGIDPGYRPGPIRATASFTGEFLLGDGLPIDEAPLVIQRDRYNEAQVQGFNRKLLPMSIDPKSGRRHAGGYYLLDKSEGAETLLNYYVKDEYVLDTVPILKRGYFFDPACHIWNVVGAHDFRPLETSQHVVRFQRWRGKGTGMRERLDRLWPALRDRAEEAGLAAAWLLENDRQDETVGLVSARERAPDTDRRKPDFTSIDALSRDTTGAALDVFGELEKSFDRTSWIFSIWFPYRRGGTDNKATLWPNSPPFPGL